MDRQRLIEDLEDVYTDLLDIAENPTGRAISKQGTRLLKLIETLSRDNKPIFPLPK